MKKYVPLLNLIAAMNFCEGQTDGNPNKQTLEYRPDYVGVAPLYWHIKADTLIPTPDTTLRKLLIAGEERNNLKRQVLVLEERISGKDAVIKALEGKDSVTVAKYDREIELMKQELSS
jgi:hypothetical protein